MTFLKKCKAITSSTTSCFSKFLLWMQLFFAVLLVLWFIWPVLTSLIPHPLGNGLVYLGKKDYGGIIFGDSNPGSTYYYGTDSADIPSLFNKAKYEGIDGQSGNEYYTATTMNFLTSKGNFSVDFYSNNGIFTSKIPHRYTISIDAKDYTAAKMALTH